MDHLYNTDRVFIAFKLPHEICLSLNQHIQDLEHFPGVRLVTPENIHLTLKFLGPVTLNLINLIKNTIHNIASRHYCFEMIIDGWTLFPNQKYPRVIAATIHRHRSIKKIAQEIENSLEEYGFKKEKRVFKPHITLARLNKKINYLPQPAPFMPMRCSIDSICIINSHLTPQQAQYQIIEEVPLQY